jgi:RNA polymerase sigma factor (sigma-70 family)
MYKFPLGDQHPHLSTKFNRYVEQYQEFLSNPVMKAFLDKEENLIIFAEAICFPCKKNKGNLDRKFKQFYLELRLTKYLSTLLHYDSIYFDKRKRKIANRFPLLLDQPINYGGEELTLLVDIIPSEGLVKETERIFLESHRLEEHLTDMKLFEAIKILTDRQKRILELSFIEQMSDRRISNELGVSQQSISKTRNKALLRIKEYLKGGENNGSRQ